MQTPIQQRGHWDSSPRLVAPFSCTNLRDSALDEAYISFYSDIQNYPCRSIVWIRITNDKTQLEYPDFPENRKPEPEKKTESTQDLFYIIARDESVTNPMTGKYFHQNVYLLEPTKILEGILCQSLTFTNSIKNFATKESEEFVPQSYLPAGTFTYRPMNELTVTVKETGKPDATVSWDSYVKEYFKETKKRVTIGTEVDLPSVENAFSTLVDAIRKYFTNSEAAGLVKTRKNFDEVPVYSGIIVSENKDVSDYTTISANDTSYTDGAKFTMGAQPVYVLYQGFLQNTGLANQPILLYEIEFKPDLGKSSSTVPWNMRTVVKRIIDLSSQTMKDYFNISSNFYNKYGNMLSPEFTLTECSLREQLQVVGGFIHAEPRLNISVGSGYSVETGGVYDPHYYTFPDYTIDFDPLDDADEIDLSNAPLISQTQSIEINQYATEIRSNVSNLVNTTQDDAGTITDPASNIYRAIRSETLYGRLEEGNIYAVTQYPIYDIVRVMCGICDVNGEKTEWFINPVEITPYVVEQTAYTANYTDFKDDTIYQKALAIYFTRGQKGIDGLIYRNPTAVLEAFRSSAIANILGQTNNDGKTNSEIESYLFGNTEHPQNFANLVFKITYKPLYSTIVSHGKSYLNPEQNPYQQFYNQSENIVESTYYGENIKGTAARMGNVEEARTYIFRDVSEVPEVGRSLKGTEFSISEVRSEFSNYAIKTTLGLTKYFNRISQYVGINSNKRVYEVSEGQAYDRNILLKKYIILGSGNRRNYDPIKIDTDYVVNPFIPIEKRDKNSDVISTVAVHSQIYVDTEGKEGYKDIHVVLLPVLASSFGNSIVFGTEMKDNYSAGENIKFLTEGTTSGFYGNDVPYADEFGRINYISLHFYSKAKDNAPLGDLQYAIPAFSAEREELLFGETTPVSVSEYNIQKDSRERVSFYVEFEYKSEDQDLIIGSALSRLNGLVSNESNGVPEGTGTSPVTYADGNLYLFFIKEKSFRINKFEQILSMDVVKDNCELWNYASYNGENNEWQKGLWYKSTFGLPSLRPFETYILDDRYGWMILMYHKKEAENHVNMDGVTISGETHEYFEFVMGKNVYIKNGDKPFMIQKDGKWVNRYQLYTSDYETL